MEKRKVISIILVLVIVVLSIVMPFHLEQICHEFAIHESTWSLSSWNAVRIYATIYGVVICVLTLILMLLNVLKKSK